MHSPDTAGNWWRCKVGNQHLQMSCTCTRALKTASTDLHPSPKVEVFPASPTKPWDWAWDKMVNVAKCNKHSYRLLLGSTYVINYIILRHVKQTHPTNKWELYKDGQLPIVVVHSWGVTFLDAVLAVIASFAAEVTLCFRMRRSPPATCLKSQVSYTVEWMWGASAKIERAAMLQIPHRIVRYAILHQCSAYSSLSFYSDHV